MDTELNVSIRNRCCKDLCLCLSDNTNNTVYFYVPAMSGLILCKFFLTSTLIAFIQSALSLEGESGVALICRSEVFQPWLTRL